jgi:hypothetical protein
VNPPALVYFLCVETIGYIIRLWIKGPKVYTVYDYMVTSYRRGLGISGAIEIARDVEILSRCAGFCILSTELFHFFVIKVGKKQPGKYDLFPTLTMAYIRRIPNCARD